MKKLLGIACYLLKSVILLLVIFLVVAIVAVCYLVCAPLLLCREAATFMAERDIFKFS